MVGIAITLTDKGGRMSLHLEGDNYGKTTEYEVDFAEALMKAIYDNGHRIAKEHGDHGFTDIKPLTMEKRKPKQTKGEQ